MTLSTVNGDTEPKPPKGCDIVSAPLCRSQLYVYTRACGGGSGRKTLDSVSPCLGRIKNGKILKQRGLVVNSFNSDTEKIHVKYTFQTNQGPPDLIKPVL